MVTEYMPGGSLAQLLRQTASSGGTRAPLSALTRLMVAVDVARGMLYLHRRGIVHSDLKSDNLLVAHTPNKQLVCKVREDDAGLQLPIRVCTFREHNILASFC